MTFYVLLIVWVFLFNSFVNPLIGDVHTFSANTVCLEI